MSAEATGFVFRHSPFHGATFAVHLAIADSVNDMHDHEFWMAIQGLATKARVSRASAFRALAELKDAGYLETDDRAHEAQVERRPVRYRFLFPQSHSETPSSRGETTSSHGDTSPSSHGDTRTQEDLSTQVEPKEKSVELKLDDARRATPQDIFDFWREQTRHPRAQLDRKRRRAIVWAQENYSDSEIADAIRGAAGSRFHQGQNPNGNRYDDLTLILRDSEHLERFRDMHQDGPVTPIPKAWGALIELTKEGRFT